jgi:IclR family pca regulon transcriptional regulator
VAVPVRDGAGAVLAAMNVTVHAAETSVDTLVHEHLPKLLRTAGETSGDWALWQSRPHKESSAERTTRAKPRPVARQRRSPKAG